MTNIIATVSILVSTNTGIIGYDFSLGATNQIWRTQVVTNYMVSFTNPYGEPNVYGIKYREDRGPILITYTIPGPILNQCQ